MSRHINDGPPVQVREILQAIAAARRVKGLTQVALGKQLGAPQSHLSRLEAGKVDIRASNLVELARLVDLEVMLVPRRWVPAVRRMIEDEPGGSPFVYRLKK